MSRTRNSFVILLMVAVLFTSLFQNMNTVSANDNYNHALRLVEQAERHAGALRWAVSFEGSADGRTRPSAIYGLTRDAWLAANAAIARLQGNQRQTLQTRLDNNVTEIVDRAMRYNDTVVAGVKLEEKKIALENELRRSTVDAKTRKAYDELSQEINKFARIVSLVYGFSTRNTLRDMYEGSANNVRNSAIYPVNVFIETDRFETSIYNGDLQMAELRFNNIQSWLPLVQRQDYKQQFTNRFNALKVPYQQLLDDPNAFPINPPANPDTVVARGTVNVPNNLNVRSQPNTTSAILGSLANGTQIDIYETGVNQHWLKIKFQGQYAYVHSDHIIISNTPVQPPSPPQEKSGVVNSGPLNVRETPNTSSRILGQLARGAVVTILETNGDWHKIRYNNSFAYVHKDFIDMIVSGKNKVIVVDAGHGGSDPGATHFGIREKDIVLAVALRLEEKLKNRGFQVVMTRRNDTFISLENRVNLANSVNPDMFISIHANAATSDAAHGTETFWDRNYSHQESKMLAEILQHELVTKLQTRNRRVEEAGFFVIRNTHAPSVLVELGFVTNQQEAQRMTTAKFQDDAAEALLQGILKFYQN